MSVDSPDANASASDAGSSDYDQMLTTLDTAIEEAREKIESGRVYDAENERVRIKWIRALAYAVNVRRQVTNDGNSRNWPNVSRRWKLPRVTRPRTGRTP